MALTKVPNNLITADAIDGTLIADNAIDSEHYTDGSIDLAHMSVNSIDSDQYVDGSIDADHLASNAVTSAKLDTNIAVGGTLAVTGDATFSNDIKWSSDAAGDIGATSGNRPNNIILAGGLAVNTSLGGAGTINAGGAVNFASTLGVTGNTTVGGTLGVTGVATFTAVPVLPANSIDSAHYVDGSIDTDHIGDAQITSAKLASGAGGIGWQAVVTSNTTMVSARGYFVNTTSGAISMTLPSGPSIGDYIHIIDYAGTFDTNNCTVVRATHPIQGAASDLTVATERAGFTLVFVDSTQGWLLTEK